MRRNHSSEELDLVPVMNLVAILIPFLLFSAQFVELSVVENTLPGMHVDTRPADTEPLALRVEITEMGYEVHASKSALPESVELGCVGGFCRSPSAWDTKGLTELLSTLKRDHPSEESLIVVPDGAVPYEVLIATMDAARSDEGELLFPAVMVAGGA